MIVLGVPEFKIVGFVQFPPVLVATLVESQKPPGFATAANSVPEADTESPVQPRDPALP